MKNNLFSWVAVGLLLVLPLALVIAGRSTKRSTERSTEQPANPATPSASEGTDGARRMGERLRELTNQLDVALVPWVANDRRATMYAEKLARTTDPDAQIGLEFNLAEELLSDGENAEALAHLSHMEANAREHGVTLLPAELQQVRLRRAQAYMRMGELENCCAGHNPDSCLLPLRGGAIYQRQAGPRRAIQVLEDELAQVPDNPTARWLINICYMTVGEYPGGVPKQWLIDPKGFESEYDIKRFPEIAMSAGLDTFGLSGGCIVDDFDGDGLVDVVRSDLGFAAQMRFFHNNGDGTFADRTKEAGLIGEMGGLNITSADYDNDGHLDILVLRGGWLGKGAIFPKSLLHNNGNGTFSDVTEKAGLLLASATQTATWFDYDGDGRLDIFIGNETTDPADPHPCELFHNNGDGTFTECALASGIRVTDFVKAVASGDYNRDGRPDLYISQRTSSRKNILLRNDGPRDPRNPKAGWKFTNVTDEAGLGKPIASFPCWFFDYDNDGWPDIFVCGYAGGIKAVVEDFDGAPPSGTRPRLYHNNRDGTFTDVAPESKKLNMTTMGMGCNFGDLDNDGFLDFYIGTGEPSYNALFPNRMFRNDGAGHFQDVTTSGGFGHLQKGHGIAFADVNNDGQEDIYEVMGGALSGDKYYSVLYANPGHEGHWVTLSLEGVQSNRGAMGAVVHVIVDTTKGERSIYRTVSTGGSFGCSPLRQHIGLADAEGIRSVEIFWPETGKTQRIPGMPMDGFYKIREGGSSAVAWKLPAFRFRDATAPQFSRR